jgi:hypothetical protein
MSQEENKMSQEEIKETVENFEKILGSDWYELLELAYLNVKYKNSCIFIPREFLPMKSNYMNLISKYQANFQLKWKCVGDTELAFIKAQEADPYTLLDVPTSLADEDYGDGNECILMAPYALRYSMDVYINFLNKCMSNKRMVVIPISFHTQNNENAHANMLIFDKKHKTLERFEPHGLITPDEFNPSGLNDALKEFGKLLDPETVYISPMYFCPINGPQTVEEITMKEFGIPLSIGSCSIWSLLYAEIRLSKPDMEREKAVSFLAKAVYKRSKSIVHYIINVINMLIGLSDALQESDSVEEVQEAISNIVLWRVKKK